MFARLNYPLHYVQCNPKPYHFTQNLTNKINIVFVDMIFLNIVINIKFIKFVFRKLEKILATCNFTSSKQHFVYLTNVLAYNKLFS
jgi:hypothetical protein